jgi:hypothetical protein
VCRTFEMTHVHYCPEQFVLIELEDLWAVEPNLLSTGAVTHKIEARRN